MQGSGLYIKVKDKFVELPKRKKKRIDWKFILLWACLGLGFFTGFVLHHL